MFTHSLVHYSLRQRLTGIPQTHHHLAQALAPTPAMLPNRPHLDWIDTRSKHITRQGSHQTRNQEQLMIISRVSAFQAPLCFGPPCLRTSVEALPISTSFYPDPPLVSSSSVDRDSSASTPPPPATNSGRPVTNIDPGSATADSSVFQCSCSHDISPSAGKIGLLPKRPVSLVNTESQSSHADEEDEEELEYLENPFEEGKYS